MGTNEKKFQWQCGICKKTMFHEKSISRYKKRCSEYNTEVKSFQCLKCKRTFVRGDNLKRHYLSCSQKEEKDLTCDVCLKPFLKK